MNTKMKVLSLLSLAVIVATFAALAFAPAAYAFDGRTGNQIVIGADEVINDDLYLTAEEILIEGTVNGDVMAVGNTITVTGKITGDLWAAGRQVVVDGELGDDLFVAGATVTLGSEATVADDVFSAGASVETEPGSQIGGSLFQGAFQGLVAGTVAENWQAGANRLRLEGTIGGDAKLSVDTSSDTSGFQKWSFGPEMPDFPIVPSGLTFGNEAQIAGKPGVHQLGVGLGPLNGFYRRAAPAASCRSTGQARGQRRTGDSKWCGFVSLQRHPRPDRPAAGYCFVGLVGALRHHPPQRKAAVTPVGIAWHRLPGCPGNPTGAVLPIWGDPVGRHPLRRSDPG